MEYLNYKTYLKSKEWKKKRNQTKYWHKNKCAICGSKKIDIHHKTYKNGWGNEDVKYHLIPLCREHHKSVHLFKEKENLSIYEATEKYIKINKKPKIKKWSNMTPFEISVFLGKGL